MGVIEGVYNANQDICSSLSIADLLTYLYFYKRNVIQILNLDDRDRLVLSKGHCAPALYATLQKEDFDKKELKTLRHIGAMLQGHPDMKHTLVLICQLVHLDKAYQQLVEWL